MITLKIGASNGLPFLKFITHLVKVTFKKEKILFSKEIEVMYDVEQSDVNSFIEKELSPDRYQAKEILGEFYFTTTK